MVHRLSSLVLVASACVLAVTSHADPPRKKTSRRITPAAPLASLALQPAQVTLDGSYSFQTLAIVGTARDGSGRDLTEEAALVSTNPSVVRIQNGVAYPVGDGTAEVTATVAGRSAKTRFTVKNTRTNTNLSFANAVTPLLVKYGCVGGACHGAPNGQGGLKLSYFGYDSKKDWEAIVKGDGGRRIDLKNPDKSLIARKPAMLVGHVGGKRIAPTGPEFRLFVEWVKAGAPYAPKTRVAEVSQGRGPRLAAIHTADTTETEIVAPRLERLEVTPGARMIRETRTRHRLLVTAHYSDGSQRDVTPFARYASGDEGIASVETPGVIKALRKGESNIMVRYADKVGVASLTVLPEPPMVNYPKIAASNFVDENVFAKLKTLNIVPSDLCDDATFIRRVYFDLIGTPPLPAMVRTFIEDTDPDKRRKLVDELLERPEYKNYQTILWSDLLRNTKIKLEPDGVAAYTAFIRESFADNKPFNTFVKELITASGSNYHKETGAANYYKVTIDPTELATSTSQIFLGIRTDCARCHNHPFDRWTQDDFYGYASFFARASYRPGTAKDEVVVYVDESATIKQPRTGQIMPPKVLGGEAPIGDARGDVRTKLAEWMTAKDNPFFARATVNRIWKQFLGRGIVHPVDDFRDTNPPINAPLLDALAKDFVDHGYNLKHLIRTICTSRTYQLSSKPNSTNAFDEKNFSRYPMKRLGAQQLLDAIVVATGVEEQYPGQPPRTRAINLLDNSVGSYFLDVFGRSARVQVAEPTHEVTLSQALALMNGGTLNNKIADANGRVAQLVARLGDRGEKAILDELYLATLSRFPTDKERTEAKTYLSRIVAARDADARAEAKAAASKAAAEGKEGANAPKIPANADDTAAKPKREITTEDLRAGYEDLMWVLLNTKEFLFNH